MRGAGGAWCSAGCIFGARSRFRDSRAIAAIVIAMLRAAVAVAVALSLAACSGGIGTSRPAADGVRSLVSALRSDNPRTAYNLMSADARKKISYD